VNGTAVAPGDYVEEGNGDVRGRADHGLPHIAVRSDVLDEENETFVVNLSSPSRAVLGDSQGLGTINDNDPTPSLAVNDVSIDEGNSGTRSAVFTVTLSAASGRSVTVNFATANGTATAGSDYVATSGVLTFAPGTTTRTVSVTINGNRTREATETYFVNLTSPVNATLGDSSGTGRIRNDD
jgi:large repetitive protein